MVFPLLEFNSTSLSQNPYKEGLIDKFVSSTDHRSVLLKPSSAHRIPSDTPELKTTIIKTNRKEENMPGTLSPTAGSVPSSRNSSTHRTARNRSTTPSPSGQHQSQSRNNPFNLLFYVLDPLKQTSSLGPRLRHSLLKCDALLLSGLEMVYMFVATLLAMLVTGVLLLALLVVLTAVMMPVVLSLLLVVLHRRSGRMLARVARGADRFAIVAVAVSAAG